MAEPSPQSELLRAELTAVMMQLLQVPLAEPFAQDDIRRAQRLVDPLLPLFEARVAAERTQAAAQAWDEGFVSGSGHPQRIVNPYRETP